MYGLVYKLSRSSIDFGIELNCRVGDQCNKLISTELPKFISDPSTPVIFYAGDNVIEKLEEVIGRKCYYLDFNGNVVRKDVLIKEVGRLNQALNNIKDLIDKYGWRCD